MSICTYIYIYTIYTLCVSVRCISHNLFCLSVGKLGFEEGEKGSRGPKYITKLCDYNIFDIGCGLGHVCFIVTELEHDSTNTNNTNNSTNTSSSSGDNVKKHRCISEIPIFMPCANTNPSSSGGGGAKKRGKPAAGGSNKKIKK